MQNSPYGQTALGNCYRSGIGVTQNAYQASVWYQKAADQDHADAINKLGELYRDGNGVFRNVNKAAELFRRAERLGDENARRNLESLGK